MSLPGPALTRGIALLVSVLLHGAAVLAVRPSPPTPPGGRAPLLLQLVAADATGGGMPGGGPSDRSRPAGEAGAVSMPAAPAEAPAPIALAPPPDPSPVVSAPPPPASVPAAVAKPSPASVPAPPQVAASAPASEPRVAHRASVERSRPEPPRRPTGSSRAPVRAAPGGDAAAQPAPARPPETGKGQGGRAAAGESAAGRTRGGDSTGRAAGARGGDQGSGRAAQGGSAGKGGRSGSGGDLAGYHKRLGAWLNRHKRYPEQARRLRQQGTARVTFTLDGGGRLLSHRIIEGTGHPSLDAEVAALLRRASPMPKPPGGPLTVTVPIGFQLR